MYRGRRYGEVWRDAKIAGLRKMRQYGSGQVQVVSQDRVPVRVELNIAQRGSQVNAGARRRIKEQKPSQSQPIVKASHPYHSQPTHPILISFSFTPSIHGQSDFVPPSSSSTHEGSVLGLAILLRSLFFFFAVMTSAAQYCSCVLGTFQWNTHAWVRVLSWDEPGVPS